MIRLGLTGGIGSGKSTVAQLLSLRGAFVIDADAASRQLTQAAGLAIPALAEHFGSQFITPEGALDRARMRELAFSDPGAKTQLEAILHPLVGQQIQVWDDQALAQGRGCAVYDIPLLLESAHWRHRVDRVLVVDCHRDTQISRVRARSGLAPEVIERIMAAQLSREQRLRGADWVLFNNGVNLDQLSAQIDDFLAHFGL